MKYVTILNDEQYEIEIHEDGTLLVDGEIHEVDFLSLGQSLFSIITDNHSLQAVIEEDAGMVDVQLGGRVYETRVLDERAMLMATRRGGLTTGSGELPSPMPGLIVKVNVEVGQAVEVGQTVVILESMKMQNELKAQIDGTVTEVHCANGDTVDKNDVLLVIEAAEDAE
ncbi:MAG: biotin/lipoyl-containing protein [Aggregatilineales bacterium]